jgi:hypothetical protein
MRCPHHDSGELLCFYERVHKLDSALIIFQLQTLYGIQVIVMVRTFRTIHESGVHVTFVHGAIQRTIKLVVVINTKVGIHSAEQAIVVYAGAVVQVLYIDGIECVEGFFEHARRYKNKAELDAGVADASGIIHPIGRFNEFL